MTTRRPIKHCRECGAAVEYRVPDDGDTKLRAVCPACHTIHYENPLNVVGTVPALGDKVLLCKRNIEPRWGKWTLPAGFMELNETTAEGAARETDEEAGAQITMGPLFPCSTCHAWGRCTCSTSPAWTATSSPRVRNHRGPALRGRRDPVGRDRFPHGQGHAREILRRPPLRRFRHALRRYRLTDPAPCGPASRTP